ncbi:Hypothetical protein SCLAV_0054 [Streptomyces clavuligerus]|uniref:Uncharacterized protein n=1 Tax=Streptomyces clavuligerus TaxID=1901 RepID=E2Q5X0_STRCL|nr:Hypothetical protein SCLAV_0054 [Streptomyces clavuligerus]
MSGAGVHVRHSRVVTVARRAGVRRRVPPGAVRADTAVSPR